MSEIKKDYMEIESNNLNQLRKEANKLLNKLVKNEKDDDIGKWLFYLRKFLYWDLWKKTWLYEKFFEEYIEKEFKEKWIDFDKDDLNPIEDKFLTKKFVKAEFERLVEEIIKVDTKGRKIFEGMIIRWLKALDKCRNETITVDWKKYTLWEVAIDTLLVDMNKFWAEDRNKAIYKTKLNRLLEEITKEK